MDSKLTWRKLATNKTQRQANSLQIKCTKSAFQTVIHEHTCILSTWIFCSNILENYFMSESWSLFFLPFSTYPAPPPRSWSLFYPAVLTLPPRSWSLSCSAVCTWSNWQLPPGSSGTPLTHCLPRRRSLWGHKKHNIGQQVKIIQKFQLIWQCRSKKTSI